MAVVITNPSYAQPPLPALPAGGWYFNSIDYQIPTKSANWNQDQTKRLNEFQAGKNLGINYAAIAVPYDDPTKYANYVADARTKGLKVYHRSHWNSWEGDNSTPANRTALAYLEDTYNFIVDNSSLYADGDLFGMAVECSNTNDQGNVAYPFRTGNVVGGAFNYTLYNDFCKKQITYANQAFATIGKSVYTFPISLSLSLLDLGGQTLDSGDGGNENGLDNADVAQYLKYLSIDHYLSDSYDDTDGIGAKYSSDLDKIHTRFGVPLMVSEWGCHTTDSITDQQQFNMYREIIDVLQSKSYIIGVNFWTHMGSNTASIFNDASGTIIPAGRLCTQYIKHAFNSGNAMRGRKRVR